MGESSQNVESNKFKLVRCMDWLQKQNHPKKLAQQNKNDIQFIIETNAHRKKFLLSAAEDDGTVPGGIDDTDLQPKVVPLARLRVDNLCMECEWQSCHEYFVDYDTFQEHVAAHASEVHASAKEDTVSYVCLWDICAFETSDFTEMVRHINYHAYHARLLAIGFNGRATLKLESCRKDSSKRNQLPLMKAEHTCLWFECTLKFNSFQKYLDHVKVHIYYADNFMCSWAGCGFKFNRRSLLTMHLRTHTGEKLIACYHCGRHFSNNHKLSTHLARQNVVPECGYQCSMCGKWYATEYLVREHSRQHVSYYACSLCDMSAPTRAAIAIHMRYRHLPKDAVRSHACPHCPYKAVLKPDLKKHLKTHVPKRKKRKHSDNDSEEDNSLSEEDIPVKKEKRKYACHMCPPKKVTIFSRGYNLTMHLAKVHEARWPFGHSRFRYQISEDGMYRLTTTRIEDLEVSKKIVGGYSGPKESLNKKNKFDFDIKQVSEATKDTPTQFEISFKDSNAKESDTMPRPIKVETVLKSNDKVKIIKKEIKNSEIKEENEIESNISDESATETDIKVEDRMANDIKMENEVEICVYDLDESGNIIGSQTIVQATNDCI